MQNGGEVPGPGAEPKGDDDMPERIAKAKEPKGDESLLEVHGTQSRGSRRTSQSEGTVIGQMFVAQQRRQSTLECNYTKMREELAERIFEKYDKDGSMSIGRDEVVPILVSYSSESLHVEVQPTEEDIDFVFNLCDRPNTPGVGEFDKDEILVVLDVWKEFVRDKQMIVKLFQKHDADHSGSFEQEELQNLLDELKVDAKVASVPPKVTSWIIKQADINQNGSLTQMELARAICVFQLWCGQMRGMHGLAHNIRGLNKQPRPQPVSEKSTCCTLQ